MILYGFYMIVNEFNMILYCFYLILCDCNSNFRKMKKMVMFGRFSIIYDIFDLCILKLVFKRSIFLQRQILEARFWTPNSIFPKQRVYVKGPI